jgi:hypothetical protein
MVVEKQKGRKSIRTRWKHFSPGEGVAELSADLYGPIAAALWLTHLFVSCYARTPRKIRKRFEWRWQGDCSSPHVESVVLLAVAGW